MFLLRLSEYTANAVAVMVDVQHQRFLAEVTTVICTITQQLAKNLSERDSSRGVYGV